MSHADIHKIVFIGPSVCDANTLIHVLKTGQYTPQASSVHPRVEEHVKLGPGSLAVTAVISSANEGSRREFQADLAQADATFCDAIVYLTSEDSQSLTLSKDELASLLAANLTVPILVLVISDSESAASVSEDVLITQLELDDRDKTKDLVKVSISSLATVAESEGLRWLSERLS